MLKHRVEVMIPAADITVKIGELAKKIDEHYQQSEKGLVLVGLLKGSFIFMADLCRALTLPHNVDFMIVSSYGNTMHSCRDITVIKDLDDNIEGKDILIVEDIIDTGNTLNYIRELLQHRSPKSLAICTLLDKPSRREVAVDVEYVGFVIPDEFVVGFGIDYAQSYRYLPYIGKVVIQN